MSGIRGLKPVLKGLILNSCIRRQLNLNMPGYCLKSMKSKRAIFECSNSRIYGVLASCIKDQLMYEISNNTKNQNRF